MFTKPAVTFEAVVPIYQQSSVKLDKRISVNLGATLFAAHPSMATAPIYIVDDKDIIHSKKKDIALTSIPYTDLQAAFPSDERTYIINKISKNDVRIEEWSDIMPFIYQTDYGFEDAEIGRFVNIDTGQVTEEWGKLIQDVLAYKAIKDPALLLVNKTAMPRGVVMKYQPHQLLITPPNTGKSTIYDLLGTLVDKTTKNTLLGGAKWINDKAYGLFHHQYRVLAIDQIESQNIENLAGFLLGFLESGKANVTGGGAEMLIEGAAPLAILANPLAIGGTHINILREVIQILCRNSLALGRRFGILAYGDYKPLIDQGDDIDEHREIVATYKALEERATPTLKRIWQSQEIREYCRKPVYTERKLYERIMEVQEIEVRAFLSSHYQHSFPHIRGGAVNAAIVDNLPQLALKDIAGIGDNKEMITKILVTADAYLDQIKEVNLNSIRYALEGDNPVDLSPTL